MWTLVKVLLVRWAARRETPESRRRRALLLLRWFWWPLLAAGSAPFALNAAGVDVEGTLLVVGAMLLAAGYGAIVGACGVLARDGTPRERQIGIAGLSAVIALSFIVLLLFQA